MSSICLDAYTGTLPAEISVDQLKELMSSGEDSKYTQNTKDLDSIINHAQAAGHLTVKRTPVRNKVVSLGIVVGTATLDRLHDPYSRRSNSSSPVVHELTQPRFEVEFLETVTADDVTELFHSPLQDLLFEQNADTLCLRRWVESHGYHLPERKDPFGRLIEAIKRAFQDLLPPWVKKRSPSPLAGAEDLDLPEDYDLPLKRQAFAARYQFVWTGSGDSVNFDGTLNELNVAYRKEHSAELSEGRGVYVPRKVDDALKKYKSTISLTRSRQT